jgi:iron complex transport system substrate-binding protein
MTGARRVVSLLPSATEIVVALGAADRLVGVSHECDHPADALRGVPRVTSTPIDTAQPSAAIDAEVRRLAAAGRPAIGIDADLLRALAPDLILTQGLCEVCAVADGVAHRAAAALAPAPMVVSQSGRDIAGVCEDIGAIGRALDLSGAAEALVDRLLGRLERIGASPLPARPRVLCVEWLDPLYLAGHWVPELVHAAGGDDVGAEPGVHSRRVGWAEAAALGPDVVLVMLCGFDVARSERELALVDDPAARALLASRPVWVLDANAYTSRPGPRLADAADAIAAALRGREAPGVRRHRSLDTAPAR